MWKWLLIKIHACTCTPVSDAAYASEYSKICFTTGSPGGKRKNRCHVRRVTKYVTSGRTIRAFDTPCHRPDDAVVAVVADSAEGRVSAAGGWDR